MGSDGVGLLGEAATRAVRDAEDVDAAQRKRAAVEKGCRDLEDKVKPLLVAVESRSARVAGQVREVLERAKALQARHAKQLSDRVDLVKKGSTMGEVSRKLAPGQDALDAARRDLKNAIETVFGAY
ncbi:hypothetical protein HXX76_005866 [Chlamydomonas incerta]|uniref:Uncharacterized protein n=1 Tax=Chlamydomonas incerta TaxID=51695 RepID=A0A835W4P4_CHLIN|nr:hypothetical protein HXX76_005866 [Chlamydomonas incerta]|eukprot:KAG2437203.1 hypothetical protein HXX76_005866 [Chlamydomonas incerta]